MGPANLLRGHEAFVGVRGRHADVDQRDVGSVPADGVVEGLRVAGGGAATTSSPFSLNRAATPSRMSAASSAITARTGQGGPQLPLHRSRAHVAPAQAAWGTGLHATEVGVRGLRGRGVGSRR